MAHFVIFGRENCHWCHRAVEICEKHDAAFRTMILPDDDRAALRDFLGLFDLKTVPQIFEVHQDGFISYVGGYEQLYEAVVGEVYKEFK